MEVCSFDWELASKFIPLITAIISIFIAGFVYWAWHNQKGKEVIANEAKEAIKEFLEFGSKINKTNQNLDLNEVDLDHISRLKYIYEESNKRLLFLVNSIEIPYLKKTMFDFHVENHQLFSRLELIHVLKKEYVDEQHQIDPKLIDETRQLISKSYCSMLKIVDLLRPYALYKTKFKYKKLSKSA